MVSQAEIDVLTKEVKRVGGNVSELTGHMTTMAKHIYKQEDDVVQNEPEPEASEKGDDWEKSLRSKAARTTRATRATRFLKSSPKGRRILRAIDDMMENGEEPWDEYGSGNGNGDEYGSEEKGHGRYARYMEGKEEYGALDDVEGMEDIELNGDDNMMPYDEDEYADEDMVMAMKLLRAVKGYQPRKSRSTVKGFANRAKKKADEEDTPFGEKDDDVAGNEEQPAGQQGGDRKDETFGPGGMAYSAMLKGLGISPAKGRVLAEIFNGGQGQGQEVAKAIIPNGSQVDSRGGKSGAGGETITREMQEATKARSYRDINRLRMDVGDLPRTLF